MGEDITAANLVISGTQVVLCDGEGLIDVVRTGQGVLNVLPLASVKQEIDAGIAALRPAPTPKVSGPDVAAAR